ncbi:MAG TPA: VanZ family protein [Verrucomicrobiae bacterium]|nr:VanZ family protein [Verrucomicrobiae bacterium]
MKIPNDRWFGWLSLGIVAGYFVVGLWPFDFRPHNRVHWLGTYPGLHFQPYSIAYDPAPLPATPGSGTAGTPANFTVELRVVTHREPANNVFNIVTIHNPRLPLDFVLGQWKQDFLLRATTWQPQPKDTIREVGVYDALPEQAARFITVRGDGTGIDFYMDGAAAGHFSQFILNARALDGQLILGNNASGKTPWTGWLLGFALYNRALNPAEIARHHTLWARGQARQLMRVPGLTALYLFDEGRGSQAKDDSGNGHRINIPVIFQPIHRDLLLPPWKDVSYNRPDYSDIAINVLGFLPFGFCFFLYRHARKPHRLVANALLAVLAGITISLTIEIIQAWLPNRTSSMNDFLTDTAGTLLGVALALVIRAKVANAESTPKTR